MVGSSLTRASVLHVGLGVGGATIASGSHIYPTYSCDGWVGELGVVGVSSIFGWVRGTGTFTPVFPTFVLVSRMHLAQQYRGNGHFLSAASSSRYKAMVDGSLTRASTECRFGCQWDYHRVWILYSPIAFVDFSLVDLIFISRYF
jgi:hypothetical protein